MEKSVHFGGPVSKNREAEDIWSVEEELDQLLNYLDNAARSNGCSHVLIHENPCVHINNKMNCATYRSHRLGRLNNAGWGWIILMDKKYYRRNKLAKEIAESLNISQGKIHTRGIWLGLLFFFFFSDEWALTDINIVPKSLFLLISIF